MTYSLESGRSCVYGVTRYEPTMDKIMRLHSVTSTIENGFVYLPDKSDWLAAYVHELTAFPSSKHDDQADSTSQALDWLKQHTGTHGVLEYYRQEALAQKLKLPSGYRFTQCDEGEEILAEQKAAGRKIRWTGQAWVDAAVNDGQGQPDTCPACYSNCFGTYGERHRCHQCGHQWPAILDVLRVST